MHARDHEIDSTNDKSKCLICFLGKLFVVRIIRIQQVGLELGTEISVPMCQWEYFAKCCDSVEYTGLFYGFIERSLLFG